MFAVLKAILLKLGMLRGLIAVLGSLAAVIPIALALLKIVGWPLLAVLFVIGLPLLLVLAIVGFPLLAVFAIGGIVLGIAFAAISLGVMLLKLFLFVVLPIWVFWKLVSWAFRRGGGGETRPMPASGEATP